MQKTFELKKSITTDLKKISPLIDLVSEKVLSLSGSTNEAFNVKLVLEEALTNAMIHGNCLDARKKVHVQIKADSTMIRMNVLDEGRGFDYLHLPDPTSPKRINKPSGRGVFLMRRLADSLRFYRKGSGVILKRKFPKTKP